MELRFSDIVVFSFDPLLIEERAVIVLCHEIDVPLPQILPVSTWMHVALVFHTY